MDIKAVEQMRRDLMGLVEKNQDTIEPVYFVYEVLKFGFYCAVGSTNNRDSIKKITEKALHDALEIYDKEQES